MHVQRKLTWATGIIENLLFGGVVFGWANIYPVLVKEGYFSSQCKNLTSADQVCDSQFEQLSHVYTTAVVCLMVITVVIGAMFDRFGMWVTRTVIVLGGAVSSVLIGVSTKESSNLFFVAFVLFGVFSSCATVLNSQIGNVFEKLRGSYSTTMSGAHGSGVVLFLFFGYLYEKLEVKFSTLFYFYAGFLLILNVRTFVLTPKKKAPFKVPKSYRYGFYELFEKEKVHAETNQDSTASHAVLHLKAV